MKRLILLFITILIFLMGCSNKNKDTLDTSVTVPNVKTSLSEDTIKLKNSTEVKYLLKDKIPLISKNKVIGYLTINKITKLGINDWFNTKAVKNSVNYSYSINFKVDLEKTITNLDSISIEPSLHLISNNREIGSPCYVGWSGFNKIAQLYEKSPSMFIEIGLQPEIKTLLKKDYVRVDFKSDIEISSVYLDSSVLKSAVKGPSLLQIEEKKSIKYINGAKSLVSMASSYVSYNEDEKFEELQPYLDFEYSIKYLQKPTNSREIANFDNFGTQLISSKLIIGTQTNKDETISYKSFPSIKRRLYSNDTESEFYVVTDFSSIPLGRTGTVILNSKIDTSSPIPTYARFIVEFPEEAAARSNKEMLKFNGRFVVYQIKLFNRPLKEIVY